MAHRPEEVVEQFIRGFVEQNAENIVQSLASHVAIFGTDSSGNPLGVNAHMFLNGQAMVREWVQGMLTEAAPHENTYKIVHKSERMGAVIIVSQETGRNHFRTWENQFVTYVLGDFDGRLKIMAYYLRGD